MSASLPEQSDLEQLERLIAFVLGQELASESWTVVIALMKDDELRALHRDFMGDDSLTDVMTFPAGESSPAGGGGDIAVSVERAVAQASEWGHSAWNEIRFLVVHGVLHLCGWDDRDANLRSKMLDRQLTILEAFDADDPAT